LDRRGGRKSVSTPVDRRDKKVKLRVLMWVAARAESEKGAKFKKG